MESKFKPPGEKYPELRELEVILQEADWDDTSMSVLRWGELGTDTYEEKFLSLDRLKKCLQQADKRGFSRCMKEQVAMTKQGVEMKALSERTPLEKKLKRIVNGIKRHNCLEENCISCCPNCIDALESLIENQR
jgi:hypothetical protein